MNLKLSSILVLKTADGDGDGDGDAVDFYICVKSQTGKNQIQVFSIAPTGPGTLAQMI